MIAFDHPSGIDIEEILGSGGLLAASYNEYEYRRQQIQMAVAVQRCLKEPGHLVVEAGTGVGKSFSYLIPAIEAAKANDCRILISTYTITLQEQLINKDLPFLAKILGVPFEASLAKGRGNFLCLRRLEYSMRKQQGLFDRDLALLIQTNNWSKQTSNGSRSDLDFVLPSQVWNFVKSEHGNCRSRKCPHFKKCFYWKNRRKLESADIIVANHALLFSDLVLRSQGASILPDYEYVIVDEAHNIEHVAEDHFGLNISNHRMNYVLSGLYNPTTKKGLLAGRQDSEIIEAVKSCAKAAADFFETVEKWQSQKQGNGRTTAGFVQDVVTENLKGLRRLLQKAAKNITDEDEKFEYNRFADMLGAIEKNTSDFLAQSIDECVYWVEVSQSRRKTVSLISAPIDPAGDIKECLFDKFASVVLTSATLCCGKEKSGFEYYVKRVGLSDFESLKLGSPFDYENQVTIYIEPQLPEPNSPAFIESAAEKIKKYVAQTHGKAFLLFTSYKMLRETAEVLDEWFAEKGIQVLIQGDGTDRGQLLEMFKADIDSVLFGTDSFWQGVDVPGAALSNVIIVRLPFAVPSHPLIQGRIEKIRENGGNPFFDYQLPMAIIKFKQGFGRLIRNKTDKGIVAILDSRIVQKCYGRDFINAIEKARVEIAED
ncbi:MAG: hypothetical protein K8R02_05100 [Anaerohalosphaeraceae bacterium]|nr:hypothetical protein [Anaerohalosphaeraceae bacterium]